MKKQNININQYYKYGFVTDIENIRAPVLPRGRVGIMPDNQF